jgi:hypothetical protein
MAGVLLAGCGSSPKEQFYSLSLPAQPARVPASYFAAVLPVQLPEALDRPQLVVYQGGNQVQVLEQARWAGSLKDEIRLALVSALESRGISNVYGAPVPEGRPTYRITLSVNALTVSTQQPTQWQATWALRSVDGKKSAICTAAASGAGADVGVAEAYRAAVAALSLRVADSLQQLAAGRRAAGCVVG